MFVDSKSRRTPMMIVKVPGFVSERLEALPSGASVGVLDTGEADADWISESASFRITLDSSFGSSGFPRSYSLIPLERKQGAMCFSERDGGVVMEGTVTQESYVQPEMDRDYLRFKKEREHAQRVPSRAVQVIDSQGEGRRIERQGGAMDYDLLARKRKKLLMERKRERLAKTEVMDILFRAFDEFPYWSLKDLADKSGQPQAYIQEILPEIAVMNKKTHKNMYELKPEYK